MRFVVVGTSGAGKSTFASALAKATGYPYIELDQFYWGENWAGVPIPLHWKEKRFGAHSGASLSRSSSRSLRPLAR
jgi:adenylate kinase family enzyme